MISKTVGEIEEEFGECLTDGGDGDKGDSDKNTDDTGDGDKGDTGQSDKDKFYPNQDKTPEEIAADKEKEAEGKTPDEIEAEKKAADDKAEKDKKEADKTPDEKKAEEDKKVADEKAAKEAEAQGMATVENLKIPDGVSVDEAIKGELIEIANNKDLSGVDRAQALIDLNIKMNTQAYEQKRDAWVAQVQSDKKFIGDTGDKLEESLAMSKKGMEAIKVDGLSEYLVASGEGNNPLFVEVFMKLGKATSEDTFNKGFSTASVEPKSDAEVLYGVTKIK